MAWKIGDIDFSNYNVFVSRSQGLLDLPDLAIEGHDWLDENGKDYWQATPKFSDREIVLNCWLYVESGGYAEYKSKAESFITGLKVQGICDFETPYITIENCCIEKGVSIIRETNYSSNQQAGTFTLVITVRGDSKYELVTINYKSGTPVVAVVKTNNLAVQKSLQGDSYATCTAETSQPLNVALYDYININTNGVDNEKYYLAALPELSKQSSNKYVYNMRFEHGSMLLKDSQFLFEGESDFPIYANLSTIVDMIITNSDRNIVNKFEKGTIASTIKKNHQFNGENCYEVLKRLSLEYELEYRFELVSSGGLVYYNIHVEKETGVEKNITLQYGKGSGLYTLTRESPNIDELCTVLYAYGAAKNLKYDYQSGKRRLVCPGNPLTKNINTYGKHEKAEFFEDIYPQRTATVTAYEQSLVETPTYPSGYYIITDSSIDFDINDYLLGGITAKIRMKTGALAGFEFEIERYEHTDVNGVASRKIFIIPFKEKTDLKYPNATLFPAIGDEYTLVDIDQPSSYVTVAENALLAAANEYLDKYSKPFFPYRANVDPAMLPTFGGFDVGDKVTITDTQLGVDGIYRIIGLSYRSYTKSFDLQLSEKRGNTGKLKSLSLDVNNLKKAAIITGSDTVEVTRKSAITTDELKSAILDSNSKTLAEKAVRNESIDPRMLAFDAGTLQWSHKGIWLTPNYQGNEDKLNFSAGTFTIHNYNSLDRYTIEQLKAEELDYIPDRTWNVSETTITLANKNSHYIYVKVNTATGQTGGTIYCSESRLEVKSETGYLIYQIGQISGGTEA